MKREDTSTSITSGVEVSSAAAVEEYLATLPEPARTMLRQVRETIRAACPAQATEVISYAIPAFALSVNGKCKAFFGYAAYKKHYSLLPFSGSFLEGFTVELVAYKGTRGSLHIPYDRAVPVKLIQKLVRARVAQVIAQRKAAAV